MTKQMKKGETGRLECIRATKNNIRSVPNKQSKITSSEWRKHTKQVIKNNRGAWERLAKE